MKNTVHSVLGRALWRTRRWLRCGTQRRYRAMLDQSHPCKDKSQCPQGVTREASWRLWSCAGDACPADAHSQCGHLTQRSSLSSMSHSAPSRHKTVNNPVFSTGGWLKNCVVKLCFTFIHKSPEEKKDSRSFPLEEEAFELSLER